MREEDVPQTSETPTDARDAHEIIADILWAGTAQDADAAAGEVVAALTAAELLRDSEETVPKQVLRDLADEWVRPRRNVRIMEDGYASVFMLGPEEYAAELRFAIGEVAP